MYECPRCNYNCDTSTILRRHLYKKNTCNPVISDIKIEDIDIEKCKLSISLYSCENCHELFTMKSSLTKHKNRCKNLPKDVDTNSFEYLKTIVDKLNKQIEEKDKQMQEKDKQINELIKKAGNTTTNTTNNINFILSYNNSSMDHISDSDMYACLRSCVLSVPNLVQKIHFDPNVPENHNIYINNIKTGYAMVYNGKQWELKDRNEMIENMIYKYEFKLEDWCSSEEIQAAYPNAIKHLKDYTKRRDKNESEVMTNMKNEVKLILYNNKNLVINTKKNSKLQNKI